MKTIVGAVFEKYELDAVAYPHQRRHVVKVGAARQPGRNGILAAVTGRPAVCVPGMYPIPISLWLLYSVYIYGSQCVRYAVIMRYV